MKTPPAINCFACIRTAGYLLITAVLITLASCVPPPTEYVETEDQSFDSPPPPEVFFYPNRGQSKELQDRDGYECYLWAVDQTGFDPSASRQAPRRKVVVVPDPPPGTGTAIGAITGAILGAAVSSHHHSARGAIAGAMAGAVLGTASDVAREERAARLQGYYDRESGRLIAKTERQADNYRRALTACLEGRGYTVR